MEKKKAMAVIVETKNSYRSSRCASGYLPEYMPPAKSDGGVRWSGRFGTGFGIDEVIDHHGPAIIISIVLLMLTFRRRAQRFGRITR